MPQKRCSQGMQLHGMLLTYEDLMNYSPEEHLKRIQVSDGAQIVNATLVKSLL